MPKLPFWMAVLLLTAMYATRRDRVRDKEEGRVRGRERERLSFFNDRKWLVRVARVL